MIKNTTFFCFALLIFGCHTTQNISTKKDEPHRPLFHFTPPEMWMNDPNGMVCELFADGSETVLTDIFFPRKTLAESGSKA